VQGAGCRVQGAGCEVFEGVGPRGRRGRRRTASRRTCVTGDTGFIRSQKALSPLWTQDHRRAYSVLQEPKDPAPKDPMFQGARFHGSGFRGSGELGVRGFCLVSLEHLLLSRYPSLSLSTLKPAGAWSAQTSSPREGAAPNPAPHRSTSLMRNSAPLGPYSRTTARGRSGSTRRRCCPEPCTLQGFLAKR